MTVNNEDEQAHDPVKLARTLEQMFPPGAPSVALGSLNIVRTMVAPDGAVSLGDEDENSELPRVRWSIGAIETEREHPPLVLLGDLFVSEAHMVVGVTVSASVVLRDNVGVLSSDEVDEKGQVLAPWASHILYDVAAIEARRALASVGEDPSVVPEETPDVPFFSSGSKD